MLKHSLLIPKHDNDNTPDSYVLSSKILKEITYAAARSFGGCSVTEGYGCWIMEDGSLARDDWYQVSIITEAKTIEGFIAFYSSLIKNDLGQESIFYSKEQVDVSFI